MKSIRHHTDSLLHFGERLALIPLILVFVVVFIFERTGEIHAQEKVFKQNFNQEGLFVLVGSLENIDFGDSIESISAAKIADDNIYKNTISVEVESVKVPVTPTPTPQSVVEVSGDIWDRLAACESHGNWSINTGNGYFGGLQFSQGAWNSVGGSGLPSDASREEQIERGKQLQARRGWGAWGLCAKKLNLN